MVCQRAFGEQVSYWFVVVDCGRSTDRRSADYRARATHASVARVWVSAMAHGGVRGIVSFHVYRSSAVSECVARERCRNERGILVSVGSVDARANRA